MSCHPRARALTLAPLSILLLCLAPAALAQAPASTAAEAPLPGSVGPADREALLDALRQANPTLEAARRAVQAAAARIGVEGAWPEPQVIVRAAPLSFGSAHGAGYGAQLAQRLPLSGRPGLGRRWAELQQAVAEEDQQAVALQLAGQASSLYDEYWLAHRSLQVLDSHLALLEGLASSARARFAVGRAPEVAPLRAELEQARIAQDRIGVTARIDALRAALNALLHRPVDAPLPEPPPPAAPTELAPPPVDASPQLVAAQRRVEAARIAARTARRAWTPDPVVMAEYNAMWPDPAHRFMIGAGVDLPLAVRARQGAVDAAEAEVLRGQSQEAATADTLAAEVREAWLEAEAARQTHQLVSGQVLPLAQQRLRSAQVAFEADRADFGEVIDAERELLQAELALFSAIATFHQAAARMAVAAGQTPGAAP